MAEPLSQDDIAALLALAGEQKTAAPGNAPGHAAHHGRGVNSTPPALRNRAVRTMDFARPSKFNKDQLRTLQMLHDAFCRRASTFLSGTVRSLVEVHVTGAEQIPYGDYIAQLPVPTFTSVLEVAPLGTNAMASVDLPLLMSMLDRMLGGPGSQVTKVRELTEIEVGLASNLMERLLIELSTSWNDLVPVEFRLRGIEMNAQFAQIVPASEPCVQISMALSIGTATGTLSLILPYRSIEKVVGNLAAHRYFATGDEMNQDTGSMLLSLQNVTMPVRAEVGAAQLPVEQVLGFQPGDVIPLGRRTNDGVRLVVGDTHAYNAMPGRDGNRIAVQIMEQLPSPREAM